MHSLFSMKTDSMNAPNNRTLNLLPTIQGSPYLRSDALCAAPAPPRNQTFPISSTLGLAWFIDLHKTTRRHILVESILYSLRSYVHFLLRLSISQLRRLVVSLSRRRTRYDLGHQRGNFGRQSGTGTGPPPCQYHSASAPHTHILPFNTDDVRRRHVTQ
jgi:hypothetical protein